MSKTLITGGLGFIGSSISEELLKKKFTKKCILVDNFGSYINPLIDFLPPLNNCAKLYILTA